MAGGALFVDEAARRGLDFVHTNGMSGEFYPPEIMGAGAALFDFDDDGDLDAYFLQGHPLGEGRGEAGSDRLYRNDLEGGELRFSDVTAESGLPPGGYGMGVAAGDFDNDGRVDLYLANFGANRLLRNDGPRGFTDVTRESGTGDEGWGVPAVFFDYDRDGWLDLFVGNYLEMKIEENLVCRTVTGRRDYCAPDVYPGAPDRLFHNRGDGTFADVTEEAGLAEGAEAGATLGAVAADFDGDGWPDLYVANDRQPNRLWLNQGGGADGRRRDGAVTFRDEAPLAGCAVNGEGLPEASMGVVAGDFDGDGDLDLFLTHLTTETNTLYLNDGGGMFDDRTIGSGLGAASRAMTGFGTGLLDFDNDGWLDLLAVNGTVQVVEELARLGDPFPFHQPNQLFRNVAGTAGAVSFEEITGRAGEVFALSETSRGAAFGDVDNDGDADVVISNNQGPARLLINGTGNRRPWLGLRLVSDRPVEGARVAVERRGAPTLWRRSTTGGSYGSASDPRLLFGLGGGAEVERVTVHWPGGEIETWSGLPLGAYSDLRRGSGNPGTPR